MNETPLTQDAIDGGAGDDKDGLFAKAAKHPFVMVARS
jgi:hypothetical protein